MRTTLVGLRFPRARAWAGISALLFAPALAAGQGAPGEVQPLPKAEPAAGEAKPVFKPEELEQIVAPIALYPDDLLSQVFMASTYPLEVVQAARWAKANKALKGDQLAAALEKQPWDPSVKSLVNFPQTLDMMDQKLDWTQKLGDAFLAQQKDVMDAVQRLRAKAKDSGNLKTTAEQKVVVEKETIVIQSANPQVVYVPAYNPTVVYGTWPYPAYPPYYYYPPGYTAATAAFSFTAGVAVGMAWGYAWGHCNWSGGDVDVDINRNTNINNNFDRSKYQNKVSNTSTGKGNWQHDSSHRQGVAYRDQGTAKKYNKGPSAGTSDRQSFRGRDSASASTRPAGGAGSRPSASPSTRPSTGQAGARPSTGQSSSRPSTSQSKAKSSSSFQGMGSSGSQTRQASSRGQQSRSSSSSGGGSRGGGGARGGGGRGGGGRR